MLWKTYTPESFETELRSTVVSTFRKTTFALGRTAPLGSRTTPFREAVESWANTVEVEAISRKATKTAAPNQKQSLSMRLCMSKSSITAKRLARRGTGQRKRVLTDGCG